MVKVNVYYVYKFALGVSVKYCVLVDAEQSPDGMWDKGGNMAYKGFFSLALFCPSHIPFHLLLLV